MTPFMRQQAMGQIAVVAVVAASSGAQVGYMRLLLLKVGMVLLTFTRYL